MEKKNIFLSFLSLFFVINLFSQEIKFEFDYPQVVVNGEYVELIYNDLHNVASPGSPMIPYVSYSILEEQNKSSVGFSISEIEYYDEIIEGRLLPAATPIPISSENKTLIRKENENIYTSANKYPFSNYKSSNTHYLAGHGITSVNVYAAEYYPSENYIKPIKKIVLKNTSEHKRSELKAYNHKKILDNINNIVDNKSALKSYSYSTVKSGEEVDFLIITSNEYVEQMQDYMLFKNKQGYFAAIETTENIYQNYDGVDKQEMIRNCVKDYYNNKGIQYLLLVGDADTKKESQNIVPCRGFVALDDPCIPADMYYSNLDGNWNNNNNNLWGEWGEDDYYAEVSVGRLCIDSHEKLNNFLNKLVLYQDSPVVDDIEKALMVGESLDSYTWGGNYKDEIAAGTNNHGFSTGGIPENVEVSRLYERDQNWGLTDLKQMYNLFGVSMINHLGHSSVDYNMKIYNTSLSTTNFTNDGVTRSFVIHYSQGCYNGSMDNRNTGLNSYGNTDCFAEIISTLPTANVACLANSRYGWYMPGNTSSSSQFYDRLFYDGVYHAGYPMVGDANRYSKEKFTGWLDEDEYFRWTAFEVNLFGDPSMEIWTIKPTEIATNLSNILFVTDTELNFNCNTPNARVALMKNNTLLNRTNSDENGDAYFNLSELNLNVDDELEIHITAHNKFHYSKNIKVVNDKYKFNIISSFNDELGNNDGIINHGEDVSILLSVQNTGSEVSPSRNAKLTCNNQYVTNLTNEIEIPSLNPNESIVLDNIVFSTAVDAKTSVCDFLLELEEEQSYSFYNKIFAPEIKMISCDFSEVTGDNNGRIDAGENAKMTLTYTNTGNYTAKNIDIIIESLSVYTEVPENKVFVDDLEIGESVSVDFFFNVNNDCPNGFLALFDAKYTDEMGASIINRCANVIGNVSILVIDLDVNKNSMYKIKDDLSELLGAECEYVVNIPELEILSNYSIVFLGTGIFSKNYRLNQDEAEILIEYLETGGKLYMESGSLWYFDEDYGLRDYFNVQGSMSTESWVKGFTNILGVEGTFTEGMSFLYAGDNKRIDIQEAIEPAFEIFFNSPDCFGGATAYDEGTYQVIASSFEYGGLVGNTLQLLEKYLDFFGLSTNKLTNIPFASDTTVCKDLLFVLDGGPDFVTYEWSTGDNERFISIDLKQINEPYIIVELKAVNEYGYISQKSIKVNIDDCTGINDYANVDVVLYPNPANNNVFVKIENDNFSHASLLVYDLRGTIVSKQIIDNNISTVDVSGFNNGIYIFKIIMPETTIIKKIIKN